MFPASRQRRAARVVVWLAAWVVAGPVVTAAPLHPVREDRIALEIRPLTARTVEQGESDFRLELGEAEERALELRVFWPDPERPSRLRMTADRRLTAAGEVVRIRSELTPTGAAGAIRASREIAFDSDAATALFEVARDGDRVLTVAVSGERTERIDYSPHPVIGAPVQFRLDVEWVEEGDAETLETNWLNTFVGQSVGYEFRLGATGEAESASVRLLPVRLLGDTLRIEVELTGTVPDGDGALVAVSRTEQWLSTRGTTTSLPLAAGDPVTGFRFLVTPQF